MDLFGKENPHVSNHIAGWWLPTPLKNMKVNWDDDIPNI